MYDLEARLVIAENLFINEENAQLTPIYLISNLESLSENEIAQAKISGFNAAAGSNLIIYSNGKIEKVFFGINEIKDNLIFGSLNKLPEGDYEIKDENQNSEIYFYFGLGAYSFNLYKTKPVKKIRFKLPPNIDAKNICERIDAINIGRDLINLPPNDLTPDTYETIILKIANKLKCKAEIIKDEAIKAYPLIHAVGKAGAESPRLIIISKPKKNAKKLAIIGKGVIFDTGGLNLKLSNMGMMKKDMGGSACALSLLMLLATQELDLDIKIYLPIVENSVAGNAMRPSDVIISRSGISVEIDNTDAEGRLILADSITRAKEDGAELIIDFATLTGAARVALGPELPPFYTNQEVLASQLKISCENTKDFCWNMPLWENYNDDLESSIADIKNSGGAFAGSITAALFLQKFVDKIEWIHFDVYCWNPKEKPAKPMGGEIQGVRAVFDLLTTRFQK